MRPDAGLMPAVSDLSAWLRHTWGMTEMALSRRAMLAGLLALAARPAMADDDDREVESDREEEEDHTRARRALEEGRVRPLAEIIDSLESKLDGEIVGIEFEMDGGRYVYELKLVTHEGRLVSVYVDAETGAIIGRQDD